MISLPEIKVTTELGYTFWGILEKYPISLETALMDEQLCQLIREVLQQEDASLQQRQAMDRLLRLIPNLPGVYIHRDPSIDYQEVLNQALAAVSQCSRSD